MVYSGHIANCGFTYLNCVARTCTQLKAPDGWTMDRELLVQWTGPLDRLGIW